VCYFSVNIQEETFCDSASTQSAIYKNSVKLCDTESHNKLYEKEQEISHLYQSTQI
jgi:hypothetical protein